MSNVVYSCPSIHQPKRNGLSLHQVSTHYSTMPWCSYAIVASNPYATRALHRAGIPIPAAGMIASNDVSQGKPYPAPFQAGALRCGVDPKKCMFFLSPHTSLVWNIGYWLLGLVVEDAPAGLHSGRAAGSLTLAVCTSLPRATILESEPNYIVSDLTKYAFRASLDFLLYADHFSLPQELKSMLLKNK